MTNLEYLIAALTGKIDDGGASEEAAIYYNVKCPYYECDERCNCKGTLDLTREMCVACKAEWLESEVDE